MTAPLYVFMGGGAGSVCRYALGLLLARPGNHWPWATWACNMVGCLLIGLLLGWFQRRPALACQLLFVTGFCGGFTTFSTFSADTLGLLRQGLYLAAATYAAVSLLGGLLLAGCGYWLSMRLFIH